MNPAKGQLSWDVNQKENSYTTRASKKIFNGEALVQPYQVSGWCQHSSVVRFMRINHMVSGSSPPQLNFRLQYEESLAFCNSRCWNHEMWSHREEGPGHCSISKKLSSVQMSAFEDLGRFI